MKGFAITSLRWRLVTVMCLAYIIVAIVTELVGYTAQRESLRNSLAARARADAGILAAGAAHPLESPTPGSRTTLRTFVESWSIADGVTFAAVYDQNSCPMESTANILHMPCLPGKLTTFGAIQLPNGDEQGVAVIGNESTTFGTAVVTLSGATAEADVRNTLIENTVIRAIGLLIFLFLSLVIAQYLLAPLTTLVSAADAIRRGDMRSRVPARGSSELGTVGEAFNDMASALEQRIDHLSFLAESGSALPSTLRDKGDLSPILSEFCKQLDTSGVGLIPKDDPDQSAVWHDADEQDRSWRTTAAIARESVSSPTALLRGGRAVMVVPVLGDTVFVAVRAGARPFTTEEQQVATNFAYQFAIAADNARLFDSQQEALQVKDQFLSIVSHELRTPLTTIKGYAQMLHRRLSGDPDGERFASNIDSQVSRLGRLVDDLLDVTRFSRGQFELRRQRVDLRPVLEDIVARFRIVAPNHTLNLELDHGAYEGYWDRDRLEQVMNNLVGNAIKYSPDGGHITISTAHNDGLLEVHVRDEGIGIPDDEQARLFERFYRGSERSRDISGMGLGLYVTRRIVEAHGGTIAVESAQDQGSEFTFTLPLARRPVGAASR